MTESRSGSLNLNLRGLGISATMNINERSRQLLADGKPVYRFGLGQSPFAVPDSVVEALRQAAPEKEYLPVMGLPALREAVADFHRRKDNIAVNADGVIVGPGSKELMFLVQLAYYGEIIIPTPCWVSYFPQAHIIGRRVSLLPTTYENHWMLTGEQLQNALDSALDRHRPRLMVLNYPSNPLGETYPTEELERIAEVARRFEVIILSDEIYGQLHHEGKHVSIARFYPEGTIVSSGLSKWCGAGGWRLGTFCLPTELDWLRDAMAVAASETYTSVSAPIQHAAVQAFRGDLDIERYLCHARRILAALGRHLHDLLTGAGIRLYPPTSGFYLFLDFSPLSQKLAAAGIHDGVALCERLLDDTGVALLPGAAFARQPGELTARLAYVDFDGRRTLAASETVPLHEALPDDFLQHHCGHTVDGTRKIAEWLDNLPS